MPTIQEQREQLIEEQIRKMAGGDNAPMDEVDNAASPFEERTPATLVTPPSEKRSSTKEKTPQTNSATDFSDYSSRYLTAHMVEQRTAFSINRDTLDTLRTILHDLRSRTTLSAYIDNILREHIETHRELLRKTIAKQPKRL